MRRGSLIGLAAAFLLAAAAARAQSPILLTFEGVAAGSPANAALAGTGARFEPARFDFDYVGDPAAPDFGDPIPGTERWRVDSTEPPLTVADFGGDNVLDSMFQPTLLLFDPTLTGQQILLPAGTLFDDIRVSFLPGGGIDRFEFVLESFQNFQPLDVLFYRDGVAGSLLGGMTLSPAGVGQTLRADVGALAEIPEPGTMALAAAGLLPLLGATRRRTYKKGN